MPPDRRVWLFDLDDTLHHATPHIFPHINRSMRDYIERHLCVDTAEANRLRQAYWVRYGATLLGLVRHHDVDPAHFLAETHQFQDLARLIVFDAPIRHALRRLPGRKILFSNGPAKYVDAVLELTRLKPCFDAIYSVEHLNYQPKPSIQAFRHLLRSERLDPRQCILVEDTLANLQTAKKLGMTTVWVSANYRKPAFVDFSIRSVAQLPNCRGRL